MEQWGQGAGDMRWLTLLCSVMLQMMREKKRQLTSAVCHGVTVTARAVLASGLQPGSRLAKRICKTFTLTEKLCYSCDPKKKWLLKKSNLVRSRTRCRCLQHPAISKHSVNPTAFGEMLRPGSAGRSCGDVVASVVPRSCVVVFWFSDLADLKDIAFRL